MKFKNLNGKVINVNIIKYLISWDEKVSKPQKKVKDFLRPFWKNKVILEEFIVPSTRLRIDLFNVTDKVAVEINPDSTHSFSKFFHVDRISFGKSLSREFKKEEWCILNKIKYVQILEDDFDKLSKQWFEEKFDIIL